MKLQYKSQKEHDLIKCLWSHYDLMNKRNISSKASTIQRIHKLYYQQHALSNKWGSPKEKRMWMCLAKIYFLMNIFTCIQIEV